MRRIMEISGLDKYLNLSCSEKAVQALKRLILSGMQEVMSSATQKPENSASNTWRDQFFELKCKIASDPEASPQLLSRLAQCFDPEVLERVAENGKTDSHTLACLATYPITEVRMAVAENTNTPLASLVALAYDESPDVRFRLAENHNVSRQILAMLVEDENPYVSWRATTTLERINTLQPGPCWCAA